MDQNGDISVSLSRWNCLSYGPTIVVIFHDAYTWQLHFRCRIPNSNQISIQEKHGMASSWKIWEAISIKFKTHISHRKRALHK